MRTPTLSSFNAFVICTLYGIRKGERTPSERRILDLAYSTKTSAQTLAEFVISELDTKGSENLTRGEGAVLYRAKYPH